MFDSVLFFIEPSFALCSLFCNINGKNGKWLSILAYRALESVSIASAFVYRSYHLPMPDPSPSTLTV